MTWVSLPPGPWQTDPLVASEKVELVPIAWLTKYREYNREQDNPSRVAEIADQIGHDGLREVLHLIAGRKDRRVKLGEGNHRLAALRRLGFTHAPVSVTRYDHVPGGRVCEQMSRFPCDAYFPAESRPSAVFDEFVPLVGTSSATVPICDMREVPESADLL